MSFRWVITCIVQELYEFARDKHFFTSFIQNDLVFFIDYTFLQLYNYRMYVLTRVNNTGVHIKSTLVFFKDNVIN